MNIIKDFEENNHEIENDTQFTINSTIGGVPLSEIVKHNNAQVKSILRPNGRHLNVIIIDNKKYSVKSTDANKLRTIRKEFEENFLHDSIRKHPKIGYLYYSNIFDKNERVNWYKTNERVSNLSGRLDGYISAYSFDVIVRRNGNKRGSGKFNVCVRILENKDYEIMDVDGLNPDLSEHIKNKVKNEENWMFR